MQGEAYKNVFQGLLEAPELQPLSKYKSTRSSTMLYPDALNVPDFFSHNLVVPGRVIKSVKGKNALIRAFNYQLMKLTFQIEITQVDYVQVLKSVIFHPTLLVEGQDMQSPISGRTHSDKQYKRIIADFVELMSSQSIPNADFMLMEYPVVDEAFVYVIEMIIKKCYIGSSSTNQLLLWLGQTFSVNIQKHGKCYKFQQSDIFLYQELEGEEYYLAFLNQMAQVSDYSESARLEDLNSIKKTPNHKTLTNKQESPDINNIDEEDMEFKIITDRYRNSAQPISRRQRVNAEQNTRKTFSNDIMKQFVKEVDESIEKDKPSDHSKIGSLLDIMSDRSSKEKSPSIHSSRHFEEDQKKKPPLTTRTVNPKMEQSITYQYPKNTQIYIEEQEQTTTPHFTSNTYDQHHNPFSKKYSEQYMKNMYEKGFEKVQEDSHLPQFKYSNNVDYQFGSQFGKPNYPVNVDNFGSDHLQSQYSFGKLSSQHGLGFSSQFLKNKDKNVKNQYVSFLDKPSEDYQVKVNNNFGQDYKSSLGGGFEQYKKNFNSYSAMNQDFSFPSSSSYNPPKTFESIPSYTPQQNFSEYSSFNPQKKMQEDDMIFRPSKILAKPDKFGLSKVSQSFSQNNQDSKGTIYRQFTDTRVLDAMGDMQKMQTNLIRQRFKGVHRKDLFKR